MPKSILYVKWFHCPTHSLHPPVYRNRRQADGSIEYVNTRITKQVPTEPQYLAILCTSAKQASAYAGVAVKTVYNMLSKQELRYIDPNPRAGIDKFGRLKQAHPNDWWWGPYTYGFFTPTSLPLILPTLPPELQEKIKGMMSEINKSKQK